MRIALAPDSAEKSASMQTPSGSPASRERLAPGLAAGTAVHQVQRAGDVRDVAVAELDEVLDGGTDAGSVVHAEGGLARPRTARRGAGR